jgi:metal-sulfur cluster biosynthetic enzyme
MIKYDIPGSLAGMDTELENALKMVIDPELHVNVVDLGLIYAVKIKEKELLINVEMTLSSRYCPMAESIVSAVVNCLERVFDHFQAKVSLVWDPIWGFDSITPAGRQALWGKDK